VTGQGLLNHSSRLYGTKRVVSRSAFSAAIDYVPMIAKLFLLFVIMPIVELALLLRIGQWLGFWPTIGLIVVTGLVGSILAKTEGISAWRRLQQKLFSGGIPGKELLDGAIILICGALLVTPGVVTDIVGLAGLFPPTRAVIRSLILKRIEKAASRGSIGMTFGTFGSAHFEPPHEQGFPDESWGGSSAEIPEYRRRDDDERP
jgi:UPF0716 protein FxsA